MFAVFLVFGDFCVSALCLVSSVCLLYVPSALLVLCVCCVLVFSVCSLCLAIATVFFVLCEFSVSVVFLACVW